MGAPWGDPTIASEYADVIGDLKARDEDVGKMESPASGIPTGYVRFVDKSGAAYLQYWDGAAWQDIVIGNKSGGMQQTTSLGTMATQNSSAVSISGGTINGVTLGSPTINTPTIVTPNITNPTITGGIVTVAATLKFAADDTYDVGESAAMPRYGYFKSGLRIPVGTDKWIP